MNPCRRVMLLLCCSGLAVLTAWGQEPVSEEGGREPVRVRDPFWPVGYVPRKPVRTPPAVASQNNAKVLIPEASRQPMWEEARKLLDIRGISLIGHDKQSGHSKYLAMVGGKFVEDGDIVSVILDGLVYRWKVAGISEDGVSLRKIDARAR